MPLWRHAPDDVEPQAGIRSAWPELADALDALVRTHEEATMQELADQTQELGLYEDGGQDR